VIRVLLADDEALMRAGIRMILEHAPDIEVVAEAADGPAAVWGCREHTLDVALLDIRMPGGDGLTAAAEIARRYPGTHVVVLTTFGEDRYVAEALTAGAVGFLLKDTGPADLIHAIRVAARGESILAPSIVRRLVERHLMSTSDGSGDAGARLAPLTPTERDVLRQVGTGASNADIADTLFMGVGTVKAHLSRILTKLGCESRPRSSPTRPICSPTGPRRSRDRPQRILVRAWRARHARNCPDVSPSPGTGRKDRRARRGELGTLPGRRGDQLGRNPVLGPLLPKDPSVYFSTTMFAVAVSPDATSPVYSRPRRTPRK
jgi:DNA-binding NarL/FixJ family response regulator